MADMKPILLNTEMVKALLEGRKTMTRRLIKPQPKSPVVNFLGTWQETQPCANGIRVFPPPYKPGDILYVREAWAINTDDADNELGAAGCFAYRADDLHHPDCKWRPSIHMPKEAARIFLRVKRVRVERLQEITDEDAIREGIVRMFDHLSDAEYAAWANRAAKGKAKTDWGWNNYLWHGDFGSCGTGNRLSDAWPYQSSGYDAPRDSFSSLWNLTVPLKDWDTYGWDANPWVWVIEFERISADEAKNHERTS